MISEAIGSLATLVALAVTWVYLGQNGNPVPSPAPASVQSAHANPEPGNDDPEAADDSDSVDCEAADDEWQAGFDASPLAPKRVRMSSMVGHHFE